MTSNRWWCDSTRGYQRHTWGCSSVGTSAAFATPRPRVRSPPPPGTAYVIDLRGVGAGQRRQRATANEMTERAVSSDGSSRCPTSTRSGVQVPHRPPANTSRNAVFMGMWRRRSSRHPVKVKVAGSSPVIPAIWERSSTGRALG